MYPLTPSASFSVPPFYARPPTFFGRFCTRALLHLDFDNSSVDYRYYSASVFLYSTIQMSCTSDPAPVVPHIPLSGFFFFYLLLNCHVVQFCSCAFCSRFSPLLLVHSHNTTITRNTMLFPCYCKCTLYPVF